MKMLMMQALVGIVVVDAADHDRSDENREGFLLAVAAHFLDLSAVVDSAPPPPNPKLG